MRHYWANTMFAAGLLMVGIGRHPLAAKDEPIDLAGVTSGVVPIAAHQKYMADAIDFAASQLNFEGLEHKSVTLDIVGIIQESHTDMIHYSRTAIEARLNLAGTRVSDAGPDGRILVRVTQAGIDRVVTSQTIGSAETDKPNRPMGAIAALGGAVLIGAGFNLGTTQFCYENHHGDGVRCGSGFQISRRPQLMIAVGLGALIGGLREVKRQPKDDQRRGDVEQFRARVNLEVTVAPRGGDAWSTHGFADQVVLERRLKKGARTTPAYLAVPPSGQ